MTTAGEPGPVRGPGRPRDPHAEAAIVEATLELLDQVGYARLSVEAVAARAGVGRATIYRRWPGKQQLVVHAIATVTEVSYGERLPGPLRDDLVVNGRVYARLNCYTTRAGEFWSAWTE